MYKYFFYKPHAYKMGAPNFSKNQTLRKPAVLLLLLLRPPSSSVRQNPPRPDSSLGLDSTAGGRRFSSLGLDSTAGATG